MDTKIMTEFLEKLNRKMKKAARKVVLFLDNASCHPDLQLSNVKLVFFPSNTTFVCQPIDLGNSEKMLFEGRVSSLLATRRSAEIVL